jgi:hypothetical protein
MAPEPKSLRLVRILLAAVCADDIGLGLLILFAPRWLFQLFDVPLPPELLWFQLIGIMLIPSAIDGLVGFIDPGKFRRNVLVSAGSRLASSTFLLLVHSVRPVPGIVLVLGIGEGVVGLLTVYYLLATRQRRANERPSLAVGS